MQPSIVVMDLGGTHARFAVAQYGAEDILLSGTITLLSAEFPDLQSAWGRFQEIYGQRLPSRAAIAVAGPIDQGPVRFTNNHWTICADTIATKLNLEGVYLLNDFEAIAHATLHCSGSDFLPIGDRECSFDADGLTCVIGPGTGLGVASIIRDRNQRIVRATEGGHIAFAALDDLEDKLLKRLRTRYQRVSVERVVSGPAIVDLYNVLAELEGRQPTTAKDRTIWQRALERADTLSMAAVERFCQCLGSVAGDIALAQGADHVVIAGGLGLKLAHYLPISGFRGRFEAKGRFAARMSKIPVGLLIHPQPGLLGAAAAAASSET